MSILEAAVAYRLLTSRATLTGPDGLEGINTHEINQGALVLAAGAVYRLDRGSSTAPDGLTVLAPVLGPGRWIFVAGSGAAAAATAADLTALAALGSFSPDLVWVETLLCYWHRNATSTLTPDGITVVAAIGGGNWERIPSTTSAQWLTQTTWYLDGVAGDDENPGTAPLPLRTHAELVRRWGADPVYPQSITVNVVGDMIDPVVLKGTVRNGVMLHYVGTPTTVLSGTIDAAQNFDQALVQFQTVTSAELTPGLISNYRFRVTSGPIGNVAWIYQFAGAGAGEYGISALGKINNLPFITSWNITGIPVGQTFVLETLSSIIGFQIDLVCDRIGSAGSASNVASVVFDGFLIMSPDSQFFGTLGQGPIPASTGANVVFFGCFFSGTGPYIGGSVQLLSCAIGGGFIFTDSYQWQHCSVRFGGCYLSGTTFGGCYAQFDNNTLLNGIEITVAQGSEFRGGLIARGFTQAINITETSSAVFGVLGNTVWGSNLSGVGLNINGRAWYPAGVQPEISGGDGDTRIGGTIRTWAQIPYVEATNNAMLVVLP